MDIADVIAATTSSLLIRGRIRPSCDTAPAESNTTWCVAQNGRVPRVIKIACLGLAALLILPLVELAGSPEAGAQSAPKPIASGWMPYWMTSPTKPAGINTAVQNADLFVDVSPFWYSAVKSGDAVQVKFNPNFTNAQSNAAWAMGQLKGAGLKVIPSIADASGKGRMASVLANPAKRAAHVQEIVALVTSNGYDGIDLDYETFAFSDGSSSWVATQPNWTAFVNELGAALRAQGKQLVVTIPPPCTMSGSCGPDKGYWVYNMTGIAPAVDRIRIMAYDYHVQGIGAIAPMPWVRAITAYAAQAVDPAKVQLGVPTYGRAWTRKNSNGSYRLSGTCPSSGTSAYKSLTSMASVTDADMPALLANLGITPEQVQWSETEQESWVEYDKTVTWTDSSGAQQKCTAKRVMWWVDPRGVLARTQLVGEYGINAAAYWTLGGDDPAQWAGIRAYAQSLAPAGTDVVATGVPALVFGQPMTISGAASTAGAPAAGIPLVVQFKADGTKKWIDSQAGAANADGTFAFTVTPEQSGLWQVVAPPADARSEGVSAPFATQVVSVVSARVKDSVVTRGAPLQVRASTAPAINGQRLVLQQKVGEKWIDIKRIAVDAKGRAVFKMAAPGKKGRYTYRIMSTPKSNLRSGLSAELPVRVK